MLAPAGFARIALALAAFALAVFALVGCATDGADDPPPSTVVNAVDVPIDGLSADDIARFDDGDAMFGLPFRAPDGLGPLFIRSACAACHEEGLRGAGLVQKMVVVDDSGAVAADQSALAFGHTIRRGLAAGAVTPIEPPAGIATKVTIRIGPPVIGRGYLEAIADAEIERVAAEQAARGDGIAGRIARVAFSAIANPDTTFSQHYLGEPNLIGRFGLKARIVTLDEFTADAFQGDMGMTSPMRPDELANPDGLVDDDKPGVDVTIEHIDRISFYLRRIAIPKRVGLTDRGATLFAQAACAACHVPALRTRTDYPIAQLAGVDAPVYTDLLLHDMGPALADGMTDAGADSQYWRTAPLIGMRFFRTYLHDGRVDSVEAAILAHDGEARGAADAFRALAATDRQTLISFVEAL
ncbi:MAG TPA: di-heme oxidoredictase family protein [Kofleriaceae bacterium]